MDEDEIGSGDELDSSEEFEEDEIADDDLGDAADPDADPDADGDEGADLDPEADPDIDLPTFQLSQLSEEQREAVLTALGDDPLSTIEALIDRGVQARLASVTHANIHLSREAASKPELFRLYGPGAQSILANMEPGVAATKQGVQMATLGAIAQEVMRTGDMEATILKAAKAIEKGRGQNNGGSTPPRKAAPLPAEARTPSPSVGKRPAPGSRGNGRTSTERVTNALAEMTGARPAAARRYFEEN